jgi:hypothetical protein
MALTRATGTLVKDASLQNADLPDSGVTANSYGSSSAIPVVTVNAKGIITGVTTASVGGVDSFSYDTGTGELEIGTSDGSNYTASVTLAPFDTDNLTEGSTNLYLNGSGTTDNLTEGSSNLYYTTSRAQTDALSAFSAGAGIDITNGVISQQSSLDYGLITGAVTITGDYGSI